LNRQFCYAIAASGLLLTASLGCKRADSEGSSTGNVATIDGVAIPMSDYYRYLERKPQVTVEVPQAGRPLDMPVVGSLGLQALKDLVQQRLLLEIAKEDGVYPSDAEVKAELDARSAKNPEFIRTLQGQGMTLQEIQEDLRLQLAQRNIITKGIIVTDAEAKTFIADNKTKFSTPPQVVAQYIVVQSDKDKAAVDKALSQGTAFNMVAMQYSKAGDARSTGGRFPITNMDQIQEPIKGWLGDTPELGKTDWKQIGPPSKKPPTWVKFYVQSKSPAKPVPVNATLIGDVRKQLELEKGEKTSKLAEQMEAKLRSANIVVDDSFLKGPWDSASAALKKTPPQKR